MRSGSLSMSTRRAIVGVFTVALLCGGSGMRAQPAAGQQPAPAAPAAPAPPDPFMFTSDSGQVIFQVPPAKAAGFEEAWGEIKTKTSASDKPDWKALGESISLWKVVQANAPADANVVYVLQMTSPSKTLSYDPGKILFDTNSKIWERAAAEATYKKITDAVAATGFNVLPLSKVK